MRDCHPRPRFAVQPHCAEKVNQLLSARRYGRRWPLIPTHELWASSIKHPHEPSWRWLLHTRRACEVSLDDNGTAPFVKVCSDCGHCLGAPQPKLVNMPRYALSNDNWIGRLPFPFHPGGEPLRDMELRSLARGRVCVSKIIAEPERKGPREGRQGGLVGNFNVFHRLKWS